MVEGMTDYTDADLDDAYRRLRRALDLHRTALMDRPLVGEVHELRHLDQLEATRDSYLRCLNRYQQIARDLARKPLSERPQYR